MTGFFKLFSAPLFLAVCLLLQGCNKELAPVSFTGSWDIDTSSTFIQIIYNESLVTQYPDVMNFLMERKYDLKEKILVPYRVEFVAPNVVNFYYDNDYQPVVTGTYIQDNAYVSIVNEMFPFGITALTNNVKLEIFYGKDYILNQLYSLLTPEDDPQEYFSYVIDNAVGVGVYTKSVSSGK